MNNQNKLENAVQFFKPCTYPNVEPGSYLIGDKGDIYDTVRNMYYLASERKTTKKYVATSLRSDTTKTAKTYPYLHQLVAHEFCEGDKESGIFHINGDRHDNYYKNLEYVSHSEAVKRAHQKPENYNTRNFIAPTGENHANSKFSNGFVEKVCERLIQGYQAMEIYNMVGIVYGVEYDKIVQLIRDIRSKHSWTAISSKYGIGDK